MKVVHFGDLHVWRARVPWRDALYPKAWLGPLNLIVRRARKFPPAFRRRVMDAVLAENADLVVFTGDFSTFSLEEEFAEAAELFEPLRARLGERLFAIPGNHDRYTPGALRRRTLERHLPWVRTDLVSRLDLGPGLALLGVDHAVPLPFRSNGVVRPASQQRLRQELERVRQQGRRAILAGHFPYATPPEYPESWEHRLLGAEDFVALLRAFPPALYLHGHKHVRWALRSADTPDTLCLNCGSAGMRHPNPVKQAGYLRFELEADGSIRGLEALHYGAGGEWIAMPLNPDPA